MELLSKLLAKQPVFQGLLAAQKKNEPVAVSGGQQINHAHLISAFYQETGRPVVAICQDDMAAKRMAQDLEAFLGISVTLLPSRDLTFYDVAGVSRQWEQKRLRILYEMSLGRVPVLVASLEAACLRTVPKQTLWDAAIVLKQSGQYDIDALCDRLVKAGYARCTLVEGVGQFAVRGGILDIFSPSYDAPVRIEFFGDELDAMGFFDPLTQRRTENTEEVTLLPICETQPALHPGGIPGLIDDLKDLIARQKRRKLPNEALIHTLEQDISHLEGGLTLTAADRYMALIYPEFAACSDYFPLDTAVFFCDYGNLTRAAKQRTQELGLQLDGLLETGLLLGSLCEFSQDFEDFCGNLAQKMVVYIDSFLGAAYPTSLPPKQLLNLVAKQLPSYGGNLETAVGDLKFYQKHDYATLVLCGNKRRGEILAEMLRNNNVSAFLAFPAVNLPKAGQVLLTDGSLSFGMEYPEQHLAIVTEGQLISRPEKRRHPTAKKATNRQKLSSFADLSPGDLIVHEYHGIGRYVAMEQMKMDGVIKDYVKIAYQGSDTLYVPATQLDLISKYIGGGENTAVKLNKLGGDTWQKTKARAKSAAKDLAAGLIKLYAERKRCEGYAFAADSPWQQEFEDNFPYAETDDQLRCIAEIKGDMEAPIPMDRLLCGDVGFGKTEVALRAAMKAILDGKQVAILVPTTVLARQHYLTCVSRFRGYPVNIDVLSRFRTPAQLRKTVADIQAGTVDLVIGTHKLLQKDIEFKNLGLLIVDEEQRFGVSHKERLKEMSRGVDVLTLSATPIPRTLNMALSGLRDMSTIEEPPQDRYPVQTFVMEHVDAVVHDAMRRELERGGQVYYLHNRVESIEQCAARIKKALPEASVAVAHGQMNEEQLGDVMQSMSDGEVQILVCTTIIETGIDIPNVNTLIIEDADRLGLAQLHQIRGRVGRSNRHAFAYLTFRRGKVLTEIAEKRLGAIRDFAEFGSGFKIAMRDLEIRGAGNLLGAEQSGHLISVGYDMYLKLLEDAVLEERGDKRPQEVECTADLSVTANIAKNYVSSGEQRMDLYRRMAAIRSKEDADELLDEIVDRYGDPPKGVMNLIDVALLRADAALCGICDISQKSDQLRFTAVQANFEAVSALCAEDDYKGRLFFVPTSEKPALTLRLRKGDEPLKQAERFVRRYSALVAPE